MAESALCHLQRLQYSMDLESKDMLPYTMTAEQVQQFEELRRQHVLHVYAMERNKIHLYAAEHGVPLDQVERQYHHWLENQIAAHNAANHGGFFNPSEYQNINVGDRVSAQDLYYTLAAAIIPAQGSPFHPYPSEDVTGHQAEQHAQQRQHEQQLAEAASAAPMMTDMAMDTSVPYPTTAPGATTMMPGTFGQPMEQSVATSGAMYHPHPHPTYQNEQHAQAVVLEAAAAAAAAAEGAAAMNVYGACAGATPAAQQMAAAAAAAGHYASGGAEHAVTCGYSEEHASLVRQINAMNAMMLGKQMAAAAEEHQRLLLLSNHAAAYNGTLAPSPNISAPMMAELPKKLPLTAKVVREGYLMKRGEHIRNWRRRYFVLREDGTFFGFKAKPKTFLATPLNNFTVRNCKIKTYNKPKPFCFAVQGLQWTTVVHRLFFVESEEERQEWISKIKMVADRLKTSDAAPTDVSVVDGGDGLALEETENRRRSRVKIEDFDLIKVLGKGTFGKVILSRMKDTGQMYAMKLLKKSVLIEKEEIAHTHTECRVLRSLEHPFLTKMRYSFTTPVYLCFVMEYVNGGELFYHLTKVRKFSDDTARFYGAELTSALGYMHQFGIIYRDLKLENILLDQFGHIKIADFGLCKEEVFNGESTKTFCGTPEYLAPEVLRENDYDKSVDWWGLGVVMFEMLCGRLPFYSKDHEILFELILNESIVTPPHLSSAARDLLTHLLARDPAHRLGGGINDALEVMAHIFFAPIDWDRLVRREITPPWRPDVRDAYDTKYIPDEFVNETVQLTPPNESSFTCPDDVDPYFRSFSFHGSRQSLIYGSESLASTSYSDLHGGIGSPIQE